MTPVGESLRAPAREFAARAARFGADALVRVRPTGDGTVELWTLLPFRVLACRTVPVAEETADLTVRAVDLRDHDPAGPPPARRDGEWRTALPASPGRVVETLPGAELRRLDSAAAAALAARRGKGVGDRRLRDALLDHVAVTVVDGDGARHEVALRLVVGLLRMGLHDPERPVGVRLAGRRLGLQGSRGSVWGLETGLRVL